MNKQNFSLVLVCCLAFAFFACSATGGGPSTIVGYVQSAKTDENDNPTDIYIFDGKDNYHVEKNKRQTELLDLVDRQVKVQGTVSKGWGSKEMDITVKSYEVLDKE